MLNLKKLNNQGYKALQTLNFWNRGENHLIFTTVPGNLDHNLSNELLIGKSMIAGGGLFSTMYRSNFDISIPAISPLIKKFHPKRIFIKLGL